MSRIGKKPIVIPDNVKIEFNGRHMKVTGPLGTNKMDIHPRIKVNIDEVTKTITVINESPNDRQCKQLHGTMRALIANMITGVTKGFTKKMELYGTGYSVNEKGGKLVFNVGFCHPVERKIPEGIKVKVEVNATRGDDVPAVFILTGIDKCKLGQFAAELRAIRPPEPYKGKGIRYADEYVRRKVGKAFTSGAA